MTRPVRSLSEVAQMRKDCTPIEKNGTEDMDPGQNCCAVKSERRGLRLDLVVN